MLRKLSPCVLLALSLLLTACSSYPRISAPIAPALSQRGDLIAAERIRGYPSLVAKAMVWITGMYDRVPVKYGVDLYRLRYRTLDENGELTEATGLLTLPRAEQAIGVLSWQHGTTVTRDQVPSTPTLDEGVLASLAFAGHGYVLLAPDYVGLGGSIADHPYYHAPTAAANIRDLIVAAKAAVSTTNLEWPEALFLTGFSQGGFNTMVSLKDIEASPIAGSELIAAASIAGPFDLAGFSVPNALKGESPSASLYLAYMLNSYSRIYDVPLASIVAEPYASAIPGVFSGLLSPDDVAAALPSDPRALFNEQSLAQFDAGDLGWFGDRLRENSVEGWMPETPVRLYYGNEDVDVSPVEATSQVERWANEGLLIVAEDVGPFDHNQSVIEAAPRIRDWFDSLLVPGL